MSLTPSVVPASDSGLSLSDAVAAHLNNDRRWRDRDAKVGLGRTGPSTIDLIDVDDAADVEAAPKQAAEEGIASLVRRANHDDLTGLANRSWFTRAVDRSRFERTTDRPGALFLIDLDGFKAVNDSWGHGSGDAVLVEVAKRLGSLFSASAICARFGGDEFAVWIPDCAESRAVFVAERILSTVAEPIPGDLMLSVGASIGWVVTDDGAPVGTLLSRADIAMYAIKEKGGRGHRMFDRALASQRVEGRVLQREIRHGLTVGQFAMARQPIVDRYGVEVACEGLARWCHPRRGMLAPGDFLPAVEAGGNNEAFDHYMLAQAIAELDVQPDVDQVWVNLTDDTLNPTLVDRLQDLLDAGLIDPDHIVFEISERVPAESIRVVETIRGIDALGFKIAIDDFGSGFSRLSAMANLPISYVKIDRQFISSVAESNEARRLCGAIVDLVHAIGAITVAEGVESAAQAEVLLALGCEYFQGYYFGRPAISEWRVPQGESLAVVPFGRDERRCVS